MFDTQVTVVGNLVAEPRLAFTKDGQPVASFRLASTPRRFNRAAGEWRDGETLFTNVTCWRGLAENVIASLKKGNGVIVMGKLSVRPYETKDGDQRQSVDIDAMAVGPDLGRAVALVKRAERGVPLSPVANESGVPETTSTDAFGDGTSGPTDEAWSSGESQTVPDGSSPEESAHNASPYDASLADDLDADDLSMSGAEPVTEFGQEDQPGGLGSSAPQLASSGGRWRSRGSVG